MIIVRLMGGLGNQLFQYATGRCLSEKNCCPLKLDITGYNSDKLRVYELGDFNITETFATEEEIRKFNRYRRKPGKIWFLYNRIFSNPTKYFQEGQFNFDSNFFNLESDCYISGFWQTEKYFSDIEKIIRTEFTVKRPPHGMNEELSKKICSLNSVAIHVRRGDLVTNPDANAHSGLLGLEYYSEAIKIITEKVLNPHMFVFSDDPIWARQNIISEYPITYVGQNDGTKGYEDLRLMSMCKHFIIANSTFSWWGAWLSSNKSKTVVCPNKWFNLTRGRNLDDLMPNNWIKI